MERTRVDSSNINEVGYEAETKTLQVQFKNCGVFNYPGVDPKEYVALLGAESVGKHFHANIRADLRGYSHDKAPRPRVLCPYHSHLESAPWLP